MCSILVACQRSGCPAAAVVHSGGIHTTNEAGTSPSQHDQGRPRQQERTTTEHSLLNQRLFMIAARPKRSIKCVLLYQNTSQAELQWKMEEYNRLWGDCKVTVFTASWNHLFCSCLINVCFFLAERD